MLLYIFDVFSVDQVVDFCCCFDVVDWIDGCEIVGYLGVQVKYNQQLFEVLLLCCELGEIIFVVLVWYLLFFSVVLLLKYLLLCFNCYSGGGIYGFYVDGVVMNLVNGEQLCLDIFCILFLFVFEEYEGGELIISDIYGEYEVKLLVGDLIVYLFSSLY